jgi:hypothetical protein
MEIYRTKNFVIHMMIVKVRFAIKILVELAFTDKRMLILLT